MRGKATWLLLPAIAVLLVAASSWFFNPDDYRGALQSKLSAALDAKVEVGRLELSLLPLPHVRAGRTTIHDRQGRQLAVAEALHAYPDLAALLGGQIGIRRLVIEDLHTGRGIIALLTRKPDPAPDPDQGPPVPLHSFRIDGLYLEFPDETALGPLQVSGDLHADLAVKHLRANLGDGRLRLQMESMDDGYTYTLEAADWQVPWLQDANVDSLQAQGRILDGAATADHARIDAWSGRAEGRLDLQWGLDMELAGAFRIAGVQSGEIPGSPVTGILEGDVELQSRAPIGMDLAAPLTVTGNFSIENGSIGNTDLARARNVLQAKQAGGGQTDFDSLEGRFRVRDGHTEFNDLVITSSSLRAQGRLAIDPQSRLSGRGDIGFNESTGLASVPVNISGTTERPLVLPTREAIAGGVAGTILLGPGVGTAAGVTASRALDKATGLLKGLREKVTETEKETDGGR